MTASALNGQLPQFIGSTGGLLNAAETEEKYAITWTSNSAQAFELPTGGDTEFLYPKDGVVSEKVNEGRTMVGHNSRRIGQNVNPSSIKFSGRNTYDS